MSRIAERAALGPVLRYALQMVLVVCAAASLVGCSLALATERFSSLPSYSRIDGILHIAQQDHHCGPAALAMVAAYYGEGPSADEFSAAAFTAAREGSLQQDMIGAARRSGYFAYQPKPELATLLAEVAAGHPVIVLQNRGLILYPLWHYAIVTGFDRDKDRIFLQSGDRPQEILTVATFDATWERSGRWALLVLPPGRLPQEAKPGEVLRSAAAMAAAGRGGEATQVFEAAAARWATDEQVMLASAQHYYEAEAYDRAEETLRRGLAFHPDAAPLLNNLAMLLHTQGRGAEAIRYAEQAAAIEGPFQAACRRTLAEIRGAIQQGGASTQ